MLARWLAAWLLTVSLASAAEPPLPAWSKPYHTLVSNPTKKLGRMWELGFMAERGAWASGWYGPWWLQQQVERLSKYDALKYVERLRSEGVRNVFYYDAGEMGEFVGLVSAEGRLLYSQWELRFYRGEPGTLAWFGADGFYGDNPIVRLKNYRGFNLPRWTLPDGQPVPSVYDLAQVSWTGRRDRWDYSGVTVSPEIARQLKLEDFLASRPTPLAPEAKNSLGRICSYDHSNPFLLAEFKAGVGLMLGQRPDFIHFDNYLDNETLYPGQQAFGPWSLANFRRFLQTHFGADQRQRLGVEPVADFDLKRYLGLAGGAGSVKPAYLLDRRWFDDPVWNAFLCSKVADWHELFRQLYAFCKAESRKQGAEVLVVGNTIPIFPGCALADDILDVAHFEHHADVRYGPIVIPTGLPPLGRLGGMVRLGAAMSRTGWCWPSVYVPQSLGGQGHENLHKVMAFDCLANRGVLDYGHQYLEGYSPGSDESVAWIDGFIKAFAADYGRRRPWCEVGLVFPGESLLAGVSLFSMNPDYCLYDYLGWAQGLTDLHVQWDVLRDNQLSAARLEGLKAVVLPSAVCLGDEAVAALVAFVGRGGKLIVSGSAGTRFGRARCLSHRPDAETLRARLGAKAEPSCQQLPTIGKTYYGDIAGGRRTEGREAMRAAVARATTNRPIVSVDAGPELGLFAYRDGDAVELDMVNYAIDTATDELAAVKPATVILAAPTGRSFAAGPGACFMPEQREPTDKKAGSPAPWRYPSIGVAISVDEAGRCKVVLPPFQVYARLRLGLIPATDGGSVKRSHAGN